MSEREWRFYLDDMIEFAEKIIATRNRLIHAYLGIDNDILWNIVEQDIPAILPQLEAIQRRYAIG